MLWLQQGGGELEGAQQAQPAEWAAAGDTSTVLGTGARSGAPTLPHAPVLPRQSNVNVAWRVCVASACLYLPDCLLCCWSRCVSEPCVRKDLHECGCLAALRRASAKSFGCPAFLCAADN